MPAVRRRSSPSPSAAAKIAASPASAAAQARLGGAQSSRSLIDSAVSAAEDEVAGAGEPGHGDRLGAGVAEAERAQGATRGGHQSGADGEPARPRGRTARALKLRASSSPPLPGWVPRSLMATRGPSTGFIRTPATARAQRALSLAVGPGRPRGAGPGPAGSAGAARGQARRSWPRFPYPAGAARRGRARLRGRRRRGAGRLRGAGRRQRASAAWTSTSRSAPRAPRRRCCSRRSCGGCATRRTAGRRRRARRWRR